VHSGWLCSLYFIGNPTVVHFPEQIPIYYFAVSSRSQNIESYISKTKRQLGESSSAKIKAKRTLKWID
jgi:hypothetical protein